ncbi:MAG: serine/threonine-protein phosphatase [Candidatus Aureabacteria bacterium]|nr:serine/threonine-protein phosphatase [Candidatus Auribacterota bacterium]
MKFITSAKTEQGLRDYQQDRYAHIRINDKSILVIADGNGGNGGEKLAEMAARLCLSYLFISLSMDYKNSFESLDKLRILGLKTIKRATREIDLYKKTHNIEKAGTTITLVIITPELIGAFWIGDSPIYLFEQGNLAMLIKPHTLAELLIEKGEPEEIIHQQPSLNSILTRCAGHKECTPDSLIVKLTKKSIILAGSDGAFNYIPDTTIAAILKANINSVENIPDEIIKNALDNGSDDNCTVISCLAVPEINLEKSFTRLTRTYEFK